MVTSANRGEELLAAEGARWITVAFVAVGVLNYGYALLLTHLLAVSAYAQFAAGQSLIFWASTIATVAVPWALAHNLALARSPLERAAAAQFAMLVSTASGIVAAAVVGLIGAQFMGLSPTLALAASTFVIFLGTTSTGWLQGRQRMRTLSGLYLGENMLKITAGLALVVGAGLRQTGALLAFGIGGVVMLAWWPRTPRILSRSWLAALSHRELWKRALGIAGVQGVVSLFTVSDVVLVTLLPGDRALAASYQAGAALSRVPLFVAAAVATAFFPSLSKGVADESLTAGALRMYARAALPVAVVLATTPAAVLTLVFPAQYAAVSLLIRFTAVAGLAAGALSLITVSFQAAHDYACLPWLGAGVLGYFAAMLLGWKADGVVGLAAGAAAGATGTLAILGFRLARIRGRPVLSGMPLVEPLVAAILLVLLRRHEMLWLVAAAIVGARAALRLWRPGPRHAGRSRTPLSRPRRDGVGAGRRPAGLHSRRPVPHRSFPVTPAQLPLPAGRNGHARPPLGPYWLGPGPDSKESDTPVKKRVILSTYDNPWNPHYGGGGAAMVHIVARSLASRYHVMVVTAGRRGGVRLQEGVHYHHLPAAWAGPRAGQLVFHFMLPLMARRMTHDLWIENFTPPFSTSFTPLFSRSPVIGLAHNLSGQEMWGRYRLPFFVIERLGLRCYRHLVVLTPADRDVVGRYNSSAELRVIPNSTTLPAIDERLAGTGEHILFLGRIDIWHKGLDLLIAAYARSGARLPLLIAGGGTPGDERKLVSLLASAGGQARWIGRVAGRQKHDVLSRSAFLVMPSRHEPFGISGLEGMAYAKPVLHFDLPTLSWMEGSIPVPAFDSDALAQEIGQLSGDLARRRELGLKARRAAQRFDRPQIIKRYMTVIDEVLADAEANGSGKPGRAGERAR